MFAVSESKPQKSLSNGLRFYKAGRFADAEVIYRHVLSSQSDNFDACHLLGVLLRDRGRLSESIGWLEKSVKYN